MLSAALATLSDSAHPMSGLLESMRENVGGVCGYCATGHGVTRAISDAGFTLLTDNHGHASILNLVVEGRTVLTF